MITKSDLIRLWSDIVPISGQNVGRRADAAHPLDFFITYDEKPNMQLVLLAEFQPKLPDSSKQILVRGNLRTDGNYAVCFTLEDDRLRDQYISLCWDMMDCTFEIHDKKAGVLAAIKRFRMWQKLFAEVKTHKLSEAESKGLIGELMVLREICAQKYGANSAVAGWVGPIGADRDFEYEDVWYEAKFVSLSMDKVKISSFDQLDTDHPGYLVLCRAEKTAATAANHITLNQLIDDIEKIIDDENTLVSFKNRLALSGYVPGDERADQAYEIYRLEKYFAEDDSFPRIRRNEIHTAVTDGEYTLSIPALQQWKADTE